MRYYILIQSTNDVITNSSTEILTLKADYTEHNLEEILLNYALMYDLNKNPSDRDISVSKIDIKSKVEKLYGEISQEELSKFNIILCKRFKIDSSLWSGELYTVEIQKCLENTIVFMKTTLGAV